MKDRVIPIIVEALGTVPKQSRFDELKCERAEGVLQASDEVRANISTPRFPWREPKKVAKDIGGRIFTFGWATVNGEF